MQDKIKRTWYTHVSLTKSVISTARRMV